MTCNYNFNNKSSTLLPHFLANFWLCISIVVFVSHNGSNANQGSQNDTITADFIYLGKALKTFYFLSHQSDVRDVYGARVGCHDSFYNGQLVALETLEEHNEVRRQLSSMGITDDVRLWTTGEHDSESEEWIWYDYHNGTSHDIEINACDLKLWANNSCPNEGCITIGGRDLTYKWRAENCTARLRYICESYKSEEESQDCTCGQLALKQYNLIMFIPLALIYFSVTDDLKLYTE